VTVETLNFMQKYRTANGISIPKKQAAVSTTTSQPFHSVLSAPLSVPIYPHLQGSRPEKQVLLHHGLIAYGDASEDEFYGTAIDIVANHLTDLARIETRHNAEQQPTLPSFKIGNGCY
jgi:hypothetical protein